MVSSGDGRVLSCRSPSLSHAHIHARARTHTHTHTHTHNQEHIRMISCVNTHTFHDSCVCVCVCVRVCVNICIWQAKQELETALQVPEHAIEVVGSGGFACALARDQHVRARAQHVR